MAFLQTKSLKIAELTLEYVQKGEGLPIIQINQVSYAYRTIKNSRSLVVLVTQNLVKLMSIVLQKEIIGKMSKEQFVELVLKLEVIVIGVVVHLLIILNKTVSLTFYC